MQILGHGAGLLTEEAQRQMHRLGRDEAALQPVLEHRQPRPQVFG
jgi:hypothetical protein